MAWLIFIGLHLLWFYWDYTGFTDKHPHLLGPDRFMPAAEGPFLWIYALALLSGARRFEWKWLLHFIPFLTLNLLVLEFYALPAEDKLEFMKTTLRIDPPWQARYGNFFNLFSGPVYVLLLLRRLKQFRTQAESFFSSDKVNFEWLKRLAWGLGGIWVVVLGTYVYCETSGTALPEANDFYIFLAVSFYVLYLGYYGLRYENILIKYAPSFQEEDKKDSPGKYRRSGLKPQQEKELFEKIDRLMRDKKLYREPNLNLDDIAAELSSPRHYVSQAIGSQPGVTFFSLVNSYRVDEAKEKLLSAEYNHFSVLGIGLDCGFNSKASFNRIFKDYTGQTPSQYRESAREAIN